MFYYKNQYLHFFYELLEYSHFLRAVSGWISVRNHKFQLSSQLLKLVNIAIKRSLL
jgi:hypothetical protein